MIVAGVLYDTDTRTGYIVHTSTPAWEALLEWLRFHDLDPMHLVRGSTVVRDAQARRITAEAFVLNPLTGRPVTANGDAATYRRVEQGEAPPLPIPQVVLDECRYILLPPEIDPLSIEILTFPTASSPRPMLQP